MTGKVRIEVVVDVEGRITAVTHNTSGQECLPYIQVLEELLEATTVDSEYTEDWWNTATTRADTVSAPQTASEGRGS